MMVLRNDGFNDLERLCLENVFPSPRPRVVLPSKQPFPWGVVHTGDVGPVLSEGQSVVHQNFDCILFCLEGTFSVGLP